MTRETLKRYAERIRDLYRGSDEALDDIALIELTAVHDSALEEAAKVASKRSCQAQQLADETMDESVDEGEAYEHTASILADVADDIRKLKSAK